MKKIIKKENGFIIVKGNYLPYYNKNDDTLECPFLKFTGLEIIDIDEEELWLEPIRHMDWCIQLLDGVGNVEEEMQG